LYKILDDLANIEVEIKCEDKVLLLLYELPRSFENFKDTMLYGKVGTVTLEEVQATLRSKKLTKFKDLKFGDSGEGLSVSSGRSKSRGNCINSKGGDNSKYK
jgi:phage gpG-like protein